MLKKIILSVCLLLAGTVLWSQANKYHYLGWFNYKESPEKNLKNWIGTLDLKSGEYNLGVDIDDMSDAEVIKRFFQPEENIKKISGLDIYYGNGRYQIQEINDVSYINFNDGHKLPFLNKAAILYNDDLCYLFNENGFLFENQEELKVSSWSPVKAVSTSSFLREKNTVYDGSSLLTFQKIIPWVEGVSDYGIGEWIEFEFYYTEDISGFIISNGFVSYEKPYLFRQNSRIKEVSIETDQGTVSQNIILEDKTQLQKLIFDKPVTTKRLRLIIKSVYPGEKWKDTCLSRIVFIRDRK